MTSPNANEFIGSSALDGDEASIAAGVSAAQARVQERQAQSAAFIVQYGGDVVGGHSPVGMVVPGE